VIPDRIEREYDIGFLITTAPSVIYTSHERRPVEQLQTTPADMPDLTFGRVPSKSAHQSDDLVPDEYLGDAAEALPDRRGMQIDPTYWRAAAAMVVYGPSV